MLRSGIAYKVSYLGSIVKIFEKYITLHIPKSCSALVLEPTITFLI